ncbi:hypothetical protein FRC04_001264 [Tulasnella sp. 424]|nr:hypothetical protein FRC04_001264 [Tulasnella sp. 424]KAG8970485.1 hypothetical protein FRC05_000593 [Tulasnella sp. 425]
MDQIYDDEVLMTLCLRLAKGLNLQAYKVAKGLDDSRARDPEEDLSPYLKGQPDLFAARRSRNATLSLIYRLPAELLTSIFLIVLRMSDHAFSKHHQCAIASGHRRVPEESVFPAILAMSHVSHHWYQLIANCPSMWTIMEINSSMETVQMAIERSKEAPVEARMGYRGMLTLERRKKVLREASKQSRRWVKAHFLGYIEELSSFRFTSVPNLEELYIVPVSTSENPGERPMDIFTELPSLQSLHLGWWPGWDRKYMPNLRQLTICEAGPPRATLSEIFRMLAGCPLLEVLEISAEVEIGNDLSDSSPILPSVELPNLQRLELIGWPVMEMDLFISAVSTPSCRTFTFKGGYNPLEVHLEPHYRSIESRLTPYIRSLVDESTLIEVLFAGTFVRLVFEGTSGENGAPDRKGVVELGQFQWAQVMEWVSNDIPTFNDLCTAVSFGNENLGAHYRQLTQVETVFPWMRRLPNLEVVRFLPKVVMVDKVLSFLYDISFPQFGQTQERGFNPWNKLDHLVFLGCQCQHTAEVARIMEFVHGSLQHTNDVAMIHPRYHLVEIGHDCGNCAQSWETLSMAGERWNHPVEIHEAPRTDA